MSGLPAYPAADFDRVATGPYQIASHPPVESRLLSSFFVGEFGEYPDYLKMGIVR
jgi:hypothetical protein